MITLLTLASAAWGCLFFRLRGSPAIEWMLGLWAGATTGRLVFWATPMSLAVGVLTANWWLAIAAFPLVWLGAIVGHQKAQGIGRFKTPWFRDAIFLTLRGGYWFLPLGLVCWYLGFQFWWLMVLIPAVASAPIYELAYRLHEKFGEKIANLHIDPTNGLISTAEIFMGMAVGAGLALALLL
jgi:hypothetical protein